MSWTVAELIRELQQRPQDAVVVTAADGSDLVGVGEGESTVQLYFGRLVVFETPDQPSMEMTR